MKLSDFMAQFGVNVDSQVSAEDLEMDVRVYVDSEEGFYGEPVEVAFDHNEGEITIDCKLI